MITVRIPTGGRRKIEGTLFLPHTPRRRHPGVLFLHGWGSDRQKHFLAAERLRDLGFISLAVDLRGHGRTHALGQSVSAKDNLRDALAAYDFLASRNDIDETCIMMAGFSYGGFLAILVSAERRVRWLAIRSPALYRDDDLSIPKATIPRRGLMAFRRRRLSPGACLGLQAAATVEADVLLIEAEFDRVVPHQQIRNYLNAFRRAKSVAYRVIRGADHAMSQEKWYAAVLNILVRWLKRKQYS
jgi:dienelactone hydrolase